MELARLRQPILAHGRIEDQPDFVRGTRHGLTEGALYLSKLIHEIRFGMKTAGGVHKDNVGFPSSRRRQSIERNGRRIGAGLGFDDIHLHAATPLFKLLAGRGPEGISWDQDDALAPL